MTKMADSVRGWLSIALTVAVVIVGATLYVARAATGDDVLTAVETHRVSGVHPGVYEEIEQLRTELKSDHNELKELILLLRDLP